MLQPELQKINPSTLSHRTASDDLVQIPSAGADSSWHSLRMNCPPVSSAASASPASDVVHREHRSQRRIDAAVKRPESSPITMNKTPMTDINPVGMMPVLYQSMHHLQPYIHFTDGIYISSVYNLSSCFAFSPWYIQIPQSRNDTQNSCRIQADRPALERIAHVHPCRSLFHTQCVPETINWP